ncbi:MAG: Fmu (Sun) domain-containing protein [Chitinophagaceae bacterium]
MSRYHSYINSAVDIINGYKGEEPFAVYLKKLLSLHKKYGSTDRKQIAHLCYCYFRLGKAFLNQTIEEKLMIGIFLCSIESSKVLATVKPEWNEKTSLSLEDKIRFIQINESELLIFPWVNQLSDGIDTKLFNQSFLVQPNLFIRIRPGDEKIVANKLQLAGYKEVAGSQEPVTLNKKWMQFVNDHCIALQNATKIDEIIELDKEAVVQDYNSQLIAGFLENLQPQTINRKLSVWDCCAGSGGKSILAKDILGDINLTVSDIRDSILINLKNRFQSAGIHQYKSFVCDLTIGVVKQQNYDQLIPATGFDLIICDVPCSGSGTWGRTPEQLYFFDEETIDRYVSLQKKIISNVIPRLKPDGYFLYCTCSVFKKENEEMVSFLKKNFQLNLIKMEILNGYDKKADTMFATLFIASAS